MRRGISKGVGLAVVVWMTGCGSGSSGTSSLGVEARDGEPVDAAGPSCEEQFSPDAGYGFESEEGYGSPPDQVASQCLAAGVAAADCDAHRLLTREAAICIAKGFGFAPGIAPWKVGLVFHGRWQSIVWNVHNTLTDDSMGRRSGNTLTLNGITGALLGSSGWEAIP